MIGQIVAISSQVICVATCLSILIKPIREWMLGVSDLRGGIKCLLRAEIVRVYYQHQHDEQLKEHEWQMMDACYQAYRRLKGNSFVVKLHEEMKTWTIVR